MNSYPTIAALKNSPVAKLNKHLFPDVGKLIKKSKYGNKKVELDGYKFDSLKESRRYIQLRQLQTIGEISDLRLQVPFRLSSCKYISDFVYRLKDGTVWVEDCKGYRTAVYKMKRKMMFIELGIEIKES